MDYYNISDILAQALGGMGKSSKNTITKLAIFVQYIQNTFAFL